MAKHKQRSGKRQIVMSHESPGQKPKLSISPLAYWTRQFILLSTVVAGSILLLTAVLTNWYNETPTPIKWVMNIGAFIISGIRIIESVKGYKNKSYMISKKSAVTDAVLVGLLFVICFIPILLGTALIDKFADWIFSVIPLLNQALSRIIAWVITFAIPSAVSGVIGNFVYDAIKKIKVTKRNKGS